MAFIAGLDLQAVVSDPAPERPPEHVASGPRPTAAAFKEVAFTTVAFMEASDSTVGAAFTAANATHLCNRDERTLPSYR